MPDTASFLVARNPDPDSSLHYLLRVPLEGGILLKARDRWPTTARVYCHPLDEWPASHRPESGATAPAGRPRWAPPARRACRGAGASPLRGVSPAPRGSNAQHRRSALQRGSSYRRVDGSHTEHEITRRTRTRS